MSDVDKDRQARYERLLRSGVAPEVAKGMMAAEDDHTTPLPDGAYKCAFCAQQMFVKDGKVRVHQTQHADDPNTYVCPRSGLPATRAALQELVVKRQQRPGEVSVPGDAPVVGQQDKWMAEERARRQEANDNDQVKLARDRGVQAPKPPYVVLVDASAGPHSINTKVLLADGTPIGQHVLKATLNIEGGKENTLELTLSAAHICAQAVPSVLRTDWDGRLQQIRAALHALWRGEDELGNGLSQGQCNEMSDAAKANVQFLIEGLESAAQLVVLGESPLAKEGEVMAETEYYCAAYWRSFCVQGVTVWDVRQADPEHHWNAALAAPQALLGRVTGALKSDGTPVFIAEREGFEGNDRFRTLAEAIDHARAK